MLLWDPITLKQWEGAAECSWGTGAHPWMLRALHCPWPEKHWNVVPCSALALLEVTVTFESRFLNLIIISCAGNWSPLINPSAWNGPGIQPQILFFLQHPLAGAL